MIVPSRRRRESFFSRLLPRLRRRPSFAVLVLDEPDFRLLIEKERSRSDRRGIEFSLINFETLESDISVQAYQELFEAFKTRLRITDEIGTNQQQISILLPDTPGDGACKVAIELVEIAAAHDVVLHPTVLVYPDDFDDGATDNNEMSNNELSNNGKAKATSDTFSGSNGATGKRLRTPEKTLNAIVAESLKFARPTPMWKRSFDVVAGLGGLIVFSPVLLVAAAAIKLTSVGPVLFRQQREGKDGRNFVIFKFRTMIKDAELMQADYESANEQTGPAFKLENDPRLTWIGSLLRKTCVDELPQLLNVVRGEMSMVGPRPLPVHESRACNHWQRRRLDVLPGMTCIWQIDGGRNIEFDDWMRMDLEYIGKRSFGFDLKLLVKTAAVAAQAKGSV